MMNDLEALRLYLRDQSDDPRFSDEDLQHLYETYGSVQGAAAMGWLLVAAEMGEKAVSVSVGNTSESYGQPTEGYKVAMAMHQYWRSQIPGGAGSARWMELVPDPADGTGTLVSRLIQHQQFLLDNWSSDETDPLGIYAF